MPCRSDYQDPNAREIESRLVCRLLRYLMREKGIVVPNRISAGANDSYGNVSHLNQDTAMLCDLCQNFTEEERDILLYDGRVAEARELAAWWERHQKADTTRAKKEERKKEKAKLIESAKEKLSPAERRALGLQ